MEGDHARVKQVAKGHFSAALVSVNLRLGQLETALAESPHAGRLP